MSETRKVGRYEIKSELGRGGMATVFQAYDPRFKRDVAVKLLPREFLHDPTFRARFEREAQTIAALEHPAILPVYDFGEDDGQPFIVMRYLSGGSLADRLRKGRMNVDQSARLIERIAAALDEAHSRGIVHRDLKPGNILFGGRGDAYLADFGIAKLSESGGGTLTGSSVIGTPAYMSPEQARGEKDLDRRSDIYALGAILFELLTGEIPFKADTPMGIVVKHITEPVPRLASVSAEVPPEFEAIIAKAMAKNPDDRYASAGDMARDLHNIVESTRQVKRPAAPAAAAATMVEPATPAQDAGATMVDEGTAVPAAVAAATAAKQAVEQQPVGVSTASSATAQRAPATQGKSGGGLPVGLLVGGGIGALALVGIVAVIGFLVFSSGVLGRQDPNVAGGGDGEPTEVAVVEPEATEAEVVVAEATDAPEPTATEAEVEPTDEPTDEPTEAPTEVIYTATPVYTATTAATATQAPAALSANITNITLNGSNYVVEFYTTGYTPGDSEGRHVHFYFDTVSEANAGVPGGGPWIVHYSTAPFTSYTTNDRGGATAICARVAYANHSIEPGSGNCFPLP